MTNKSDKELAPLPEERNFLPAIADTVDEEAENEEFDLTPEIVLIVQRTLDTHLDLLIKLKNN